MLLRSRYTVVERDLSGSTSFLRSGSLNLGRSPGHRRSAGGARKDPQLTRNTSTRPQKVLWRIGLYKYRTARNAGSAIDVNIVGPNAKSSTVRDKFRSHLVTPPERVEWS